MHIRVIAFFLLICGCDAGESATSASSGSGGAGAGGSGAGGSGECVGPQGSGETDALCEELYGADYNCNPDADPVVHGEDYFACRLGFRSFLPGAAEQFRACLATIPEQQVCFGDAVDACYAELGEAVCPSERAVQICRALNENCDGVPIDEAECVAILKPINETTLMEFETCVVSNNGSMGSSCYFTYTTCKDSLLRW
ncbi:MAG TPA: hypothetical protein VFB62_22080 [Polyangiaceae bacterium]|jgi:hypothetical protein|nr:hypothetical protein [Polyangiaceae bacterium]